jgi:ABC-type polysaccharide/polyol phosphate transport system ATPase subunit
MSSDVPYDLRLSHVGKRYRVSRPGVRRSWTSLLRQPMDDFWALRDVTFDVPPGQVLGIIGPNGAGKSTLFKVLAGITAPSEGEIRIRGRLAALIEVGSGFHPELTGRENVFLSGTILGLRRRDIAARLAGIVEFAGVGGFLDVPVKWYSSGMYVRLGFAVAAQLEPDVLLVDEVLAVGDAAFQAKCVQRILDLRQRGTTILFISHDLGTIERLCDRTLLLNGGRVVADGSPAEIVSAYLQQVNRDDRNLPLAGTQGGSITITGLSVHNRTGAEVIVARSGDLVRIELGLRVQASAPAVVAQVMVYSYEEGLLLFECATAPGGIQLTAGDVRVRFEVGSLGLLPGAYTLGALVRPADSTRAIDWWFGRTTLHVESGPALRGHVYLPYDWSVVPAPAGASSAPARTA